MKSLILIPFAFAALVAFRTVPVVDSPASGESTWTVDPVHSSTVFRIKHADTAWFYGTFKQITGEIMFDAQKPESAKVSMKIAADSVDSRDDGRDKHLRGPDFFDAKQFPEIKFTSSKVAKKGEDFEVTGELEMRGKKAPLTLIAQKTGEIEFRGKRAGFETTFTIKRSDFGMSYGLDKKALADEVRLTISIEASQKK